MSIIRETVREPGKILVEFTIGGMAAQLELSMFCNRYHMDTAELNEKCSRHTPANPFKGIPEIWHYPQDMKGKEG